MQAEIVPPDVPVATPTEERRNWRDSMVFMLGRRVLGALLVIYVVITLSFFLIRLLPGNAVDALRAQLLQQGVSPDEINQRIQVLYGLSIKQPLGEQYLQYIGNLLHGNLGNSIMYSGHSVDSIIGSAVPWTILVVASSLLVSFVVGILLGVAAAYRRNAWYSNVITVVSAIFSAIPNYIVAILALYWLGDQLHAFPIGGAYDASVTPGFNLPFIGNVIHHAFLPFLAYTLTGFGGWALSMKGNTISVLGEDYITAAKARGIPERRVATAYVARNALLPMMTGLAISIGYMFGGSVFIETTFTYPGLGYYLITATNGRDYPLMMGCFILIIVAVIVANFLADLLYVRLDPRNKRQ
ncbi:MAG TPA: ABC transporter permease [Chloroflexota bacterium]|nr:ABC transporter permease [Chloroflexota bacterium]